MREPLVDDGQQCVFEYSVEGSPMLPLSMLNRGNVITLHHVTPVIARTAATRTVSVYRRGSRGDNRPA
jgi:hypothetical protein